MRFVDKCRKIYAANIKKVENGYLQKADKEYRLIKNEMLKVAKTGKKRYSALVDLDRKYIEIIQKRLLDDGFMVFTPEWGHYGYRFSVEFRAD